MFYVHPQAERKVPAALVPNGERSYRWVELGIQCCYFLLTISVEIEPEDTLSRHLLVGAIEDVLEVARISSPDTRLMRVDLMSPGYLRNEEGYRLDRVTEVWRDRQPGRHYRYRLENGTFIEDRFGTDEVADAEMELVLAL